ncbi:TolC family outer membrane protein [Gulbenkiania mobilis]|uniref:TolC family outer membrane protein n=1 Tax=Gulbenkiania mobilis TaxID=397457 RepID=UPI0006BBE7D7|nr:TolC family outer membrane protein [Gulbenkiania mobilis]
MRFRNTILALCLSGMAGTASAYDLLDAWRAAREHDAGFAAARAERDAGQEKAVQGRARLLPQIGLSGSITRNNPIEPDMASYTSRGYGVELSQPVFDVGKFADYRRGQAGAALADIQYLANEQQLIVDVGRAYFDVLLAQDSLAATRASKKAYENQLAQARAAFEVGTATITDTHEAQAGYDAAAAQEIVAQSNLEIARNALARLTGLDPAGMQPLAERIELVTAQGALEAWQARALDNSFDVRARAQELETARADLLAARGNRLPTLELNAGYRDNDSGMGPSPKTRASSVGLTVTMPLFAGGGISSQIREAASRELAARDRLEASRRQVREDVRRAYLGVTNGAAYVRAQEQLLVSARSKLESTRLGREVGVRTNLDLLRAEQDYYDTVRSLAEARYNYLTARLQLLQATGELTEAGLAEVNRSLRQAG